MRLVYLVALIAVFGALVCSGEDGSHHQDGSHHRTLKPIAQPQHSFIPPYLHSGAHIPFWHLHGDAFVTEKGIKLTPPKPAAAGGIWNTHSLHMHAWVVDIEFSVTGPSTSGDEGFAFWVTKDRHFGGSLFGASERFQGFGIIFDSEDNDHRGDNPVVSALLSEGNPHDDGYHTRSDGLESKNAQRCKYDYRNHDKVIARVVYKHHTLTVLLDQTGTAHSFVECLTLPHVNIPMNYYFGITAATSESPDVHLIQAFRAASLSAKHAPKVDYAHEIAAAKAAAAGASGSGHGSGSASSQDHEADFKIPDLGDIFDDDRFEDDFLNDDAEDEDWEWDDEELDAPGPDVEPHGGDHPVEGPKDSTMHSMGFRKFDEIEKEDMDAADVGHGAEADHAGGKNGAGGNHAATGVPGGDGADSETDSDRIRHLVHHVDRLSRYLDNMETSIEASLENVYATVVDLKHDVRAQMDSMHKKVDESSAVAEVEAAVREGHKVASEHANTNANAAQGSQPQEIKFPPNMTPVTLKEVKELVAPIQEQIELVASTLQLMGEHTHLLAQSSTETHEKGSKSQKELHEIIQRKFDEHASRQDHHDRKLRTIQKEVSSSWWGVFGIVGLFQVVFLIAICYFRRWREEEKKWV